MSVSTAKNGLEVTIGTNNVRMGLWLQSHWLWKKCIDVKDKTSQAIVVLKRLSEREIQSFTKTKRFSCNQCSISFKTKANLKRHLKSARKESKAKCKICALTFCTLNSLGRHVSKFHTEKNEGLTIEKVQSKKVWKCNECPMTYRTQESLKTHEKSAKKEVKFPCMHCSTMPFCTLNSLGRHMNQAHQDK